MIWRQTDVKFYYHKILVVYSIVCELKWPFLLGIQAYIKGHQCSVQGGGNARVGLDAEQEVVQE